jgi:hypothetical protein
MPRQVEITIPRDKLEGLEPAPNLVEAEVLINGAVADRIRAQEDSITVKAPPTGDGPWMILVTMAEGKKLLGALDLHYDPNAETFDVKQQQGLEAEEPDEDEAADAIARIRDAALGEKLDNIATAISEAARALSSNASAERQRNEQALAEQGAGAWPPDQTP